MDAFVFGIPIGRGQGIGIGFKSSRGASFIIAEVGVHHHPAGEDPECGFRAGVFFTFCNLHFSIGLFAIPE